MNILTDHFSENYSPLMALLDFVPVALFALAMVYFVKDYYKKLRLPFQFCLAAGSVSIFMAGFAKAIWKLIISLTPTDFEPLNKMFLPVQSVGFCLLGASMLSLLFKEKKGTSLNSLLILPLFPALATAATPYQGTMIFISLMVVGQILITISLVSLSAKKKCVVAIILAIVSFICAMGMGSMSALENQLGVVATNWIEECINVASQLTLLITILLLKKKKEA